MKKLIIAFALTSALFSCKKKSTTPNTPPVVKDTTKVTITCGDNPNINFKSTGIPIGKFSNCIKDVDGNVYKTVTIGTQTWMAENLKTSRYNDGTPISNITDINQWENFYKGAWIYYNNDSINNTKYGKLYNWYALSPLTNGGNNVCPTGWHVPTDDEWNVLIYFLGGDSIAGGKMKEVGKSSWSSPNKDATNTSLFTALPGGSYYYNRSIGYLGAWWSSTGDDYGYAWFRTLNCSDGNLIRSDYSKKSGFSVRCLKD